MQIERIVYSKKKSISLKCTHSQDVDEFLKVRNIFMDRFLSY